MERPVRRGRIGKRKLALRPNRKALSLTVGALLLFAIGSNAQAGWLYVIASALFGVVIAGIALPGFSLRRIEVTRQLPSVGQVGDDIPTTLVVHNGGRTRRGPLLLADELFVWERFLVDSVAGGEAVQLQRKPVATRRGVYSAPEVLIESGAPFGVATARRRISTSGQITVRPRWTSLPPVPILEAASTPNEALHERSRRGAGMEFYGLREYRRGDSLRRVHWRSTAKGRGLLVREFEEHPSSRLTILLDSSEKVGPEPETTFEYSVSAAASLAVYAIESGHPVQLFSDGGSTRHLFEPGRDEMLDWLSEKEAGTAGGLGELAVAAEAEIHRRSTAALIIPSTHRAERECALAIPIVQRMSARVIVALVSARTFGTDRRALDDSREQSLIRTLEDQRVIVYTIEQGRDLAECFKERATV